MVNRYKRRFRLLVFVVMLLTTFILMVSLTYAEEQSEAEKSQVNDSGITGEILDQQVESSNIEKIQGEMNKHSNEGVREIIPDYDPQRIVSDALKGKFEFSFSGFFNAIMKYVFKELYFNVDVLIKLIILVIFCAILRNLQTSFLSESVGELAFYACYIVLVSVMIISLDTALDLGRDIIDKMVSFMHASIPVLITLLVSGGNFTSAGIFQPILIVIVEISATVIRNVFLPLIFLSVILSVVDNISDKIQVSRLAQFLKQVSGWALGLILTVFIGVISIQGSLGAVVDGVTSKTAKFAIGALIPVAGKYLADAADAVVGCTLLIKNAAGIATMIGIIAICIVPLLKIFVLLLLYRITCILIEPIAEKRITNCINEMAGSLTFIFGLVAAVSFMFLISITVIISASNISTMIR
ncbi:MAG: stage III sporulation protein AE [Clostridia bacterium]|nr:stage III sporulation protein AE [Clostridia bacterium]